MQPIKNTPDFYQVIKPIGYGVTGEVFEGRDKSTGRRIALKRLYSDVTQNAHLSSHLYNTLELIRHESSAAELTKILDLYFDDEESLCIVMEFLDGVTLEKYVKLHGPLPETHALDIALRISQSLQRIYNDTLFFHGLLNPSNIFLLHPTSESTQRAIKFLDYGAAMAACEYHRTRQARFKRKAPAVVYAIGDPQYLSPEQCHESGEVDARSDVYGIGLILFYLLSGKAVFSDSEMINVMSMHLGAKPPSIKDINSEVSDFTKTLIDATLQKNPASRPSLSEFSSRISKRLTSEQPDYGGYRLVEFIRGDRYAALYSAYHSDTGQPAFVKLVDPERTAGPYRRVAARFLAAMQAHSSKPIEGFAPLLGLGQLASQQAFAVLALPSSVTLTEAIAKRQDVDYQVWQERALRIGKRLAEIVSQAHAEELVYLSLRPQSIELIDDPLVTDGFSVQLAANETTRRADCTDSGPAGSDLPENLSLDLACYLAPEQLLETAGKPTDVYALGVMLYEMLSGQRPFAADSTATLLSRTQDTIPPLLHERNPLVAPELSALVHSMLEKRPQHRPAMAQVSAQLGIFADSVETQRMSRTVDESALSYLRPPQSTGISELSTRRFLGAAGSVPLLSTGVDGIDERGSLKAIAAELASDELRPEPPLRESGRRQRSPYFPQSKPDLPSHFGSYQVTGRLGEGGMGSVYEAIDLETGERVAIKQPRPELMEFPQFEDRFLKEMLFARRIGHPGIVNVLKFERTESGCPYIVMELVEGETLKRRLEQGRLALVQTLEFGYQIAETLTAAHRVGVVHRDLKPDNVMLIDDEADSGKELVKILDFGIAKLMVEYKATLLLNAQKSTLPGAVLGTPQYMAPEQRQDSSTVTDRADVYSLGVILYEMLSGRPPLTADEATAMLHTKKYKAPPLLQARTSGLPERLIALVHSMLLETPAERPTMAAVYTDLNRLARPKNASTLRDSSDSPPGRQRWYAVLALAALLVVGAGLFWARAHAHKLVAIAQQVNKAQDELRNGRWSQALVDCKALLDSGELAPAAKQQAQDCHDLAVHEHQAEELNSRIKSSVDPEAAYTLYREMAADSVYHSAAAQELGKRFIALAASARRAGRCDTWSQAVVRARILIPQDSSIITEQSMSCPPLHASEPVNHPAPSPTLKVVGKGATSPPTVSELNLRRLDSAYEQSHYRDVIKLALSFIHELDGPSTKHAWRRVGEASCQIGDEEDLHSAAERLVAERGADDLEQLKTVCRRKGYQWNGPGAMFVRLRRPGSAQR